MPESKRIISNQNVPFSQTLERKSDVLKFQKAPHSNSVAKISADTFRHMSASKNNVTEMEKSD